ncbi:MAG: hypothetical protein Tp178MES00d2C33159091_24 [Prokaryotic dsDNA virus sp.]|nr:hypothetical protein [Thalassospira sp.]MAZ33896.1 hypothetical protein [Thalassospira sp.]QDP60973.1 MAG: hypothetical protein Tp178MES00d2C33159091_24 [Prokaryotic dsDNA virus sp.]QDP64522.1 MAG: hypothetical protein Tp178SUR1139111_42 [Prokaryotic dsDNA virus sp.]|tara:strand:+ start:1465 stop:1695 length:231 start_codon:yes stop_codon:yes gene_type:complete
MADQQKILQNGLYCTEDKDAREMIERVNKFNINHIGSPVKLDVIPYEKGDEFVDNPHYKFRFLFPSREVMRAFWTE